MKHLFLATTLLSTTALADDIRYKDSIRVERDGKEEAFSTRIENHGKTERDVYVIHRGVTHNLGKLKAGEKARVTVIPTEHGIFLFNKGAD